MSFNSKDVGIRIRKERIRNQLTIEKLSEMLDVSPSFIGLVERGNSGISLEKLCKLSEIFSVSTDYLLKGDAESLNQQRRKLEVLNTYLYDYNEEEINFILELLKFLRPKITIR